MTTLITSDCINDPDGSSTARCSHALPRARRPRGTRAGLAGPNSQGSAFPFVLLEIFFFQNTSHCVVGTVPERRVRADRLAEHSPVRLRPVGLQARGLPQARARFRVLRSGPHPPLPCEHMFVPGVSFCVFLSVCLGCIRPNPPLPVGTFCGGSCAFPAGTFLWREFFFLCVWAASGPCAPSCRHML